MNKTAPMIADSTLTHIAVALPVPVPTAFTYSVPPDLADRTAVGKRVLVPFGKRQLTGFILGRAAADGALDIRPITDVLDEAPLFPEAMVTFFQWVADYYAHPLGEVVHTALPGGLSACEVWAYQLTDTGRSVLDCGYGSPEELTAMTAMAEGALICEGAGKAGNGPFPGRMLQRLQKKGWVRRQRHLRPARVRRRRVSFVGLAAPEADIVCRSERQQRVVSWLARHGDCPAAVLERAIPGAMRSVSTLIRDGRVKKQMRVVERDPFGEPILPDRPHPLTDAQQQIMDALQQAVDQGFIPFLITGVTGSGKTEIYLQLARKVIDTGRSVLVLVPEIALISQMVQRFRARFGERVAVLHSGLSDGERFDQWRRICRKAADVVIGARSAIFAPMAAPGLIVVDEEHDTSYKQENGLRYHARDLALVRGRLDGCPVVLGSATPSIQTLFNADIGKLRELTLPCRIFRRPLPEIEIVDLRNFQGRRGDGRFLTDPLAQAMRERLARGEQTLLFLNRRGFAGNPVCLACGSPIRCPHCDISLTYHRKANALRCHYCGFSSAAATRCPSCASDRIRFLGLGTEQLEAAVTKRFPEARIDRMDRDTIARRGALLKILKRLRRGETDVLIGTQMVAKGHDFPNITLVGIVCADLSLNVPDFRSGEHTFQILAQVAGRAGRGQVPGKVILQTFNPDHFSLTAARAQDVRRFYEVEIGFRRRLHYPPFSRLVMLRIEGADRERTAGRAAETAEACRRAASAEVEVLGPIEAPLARIAGQYRWQVLIKGNDAGAIHGVVRVLVSAHGKWFQDNRGRTVIEIDPVQMM